MDKSYEELLEEALALTHPSGRKVRSDKGKTHNYTAIRTKETLPRAARKDKGVRRPEMQAPKSKVWIYATIKGKLYKKDQELIARGELPLLRGVDENSYYIVVPAAYKTRASNHTQEYKGRSIQHTTRRVCTQRELDLERYRFNAYQELATSKEWNEPSPYISEIRQMLSTRYGIVGQEAEDAIAKRQISNFDLFCEFYHLRVEDAAMWDYDTWQAMYQLCPCETLDDDFVFSLTLRPGTPEFHPEFAYHAEKVIKNQEQAKQDEAERRRRQFNEHWKRRV